MAHIPHTSNTKLSRTSTSLSDTLLASLSCRKTALHLSRFFSFTVDPISLGSKNDKFRARAKFKGDLSIIFCTIATKKSLHSSLNCIVYLSVTFLLVSGSTALFNSFSALNPTSILLLAVNTVILFCLHVDLQ